MSNENLLKLAREALQLSYSPYSQFRVGAALLTSSGKVFTGCNIENSSFSLTICAERTALFKAVSEGENSFSKILIVSDADDFISPCGACRQVLSDLAGDIEIILTNSRGEMQYKKISDLLPFAFGRADLITKRK
jgi:cytidine deaminase